MINKTFLMGRLTKDPELRHTGTGKTVATFTVAIDNGYGENKKTDFINCVAWNKTAEFVSKWFSKGQMIIIVGKISTRTWDGNDGRKNYATEVVANEVHFGESKKEETSPKDTSEDFEELPLSETDEYCSSGDSKNEISQQKNNS